jgi:hypothetical protein
MTFKSLLFLAASFSAIVNAKEQDDTAAANIASKLAAALSTCQAQKEIELLVDLSGLGAPGWASSVIPSLKVLASSFAIPEARIGVYYRDYNSFNSYWCIPVSWYDNENTNINLFLNTIQNLPCNVLSSGIGTLIGVLVGSRRPNTPVEILLLTDWRLGSAGVSQDEVARVKAMSGVTLRCVTVGLGADYGYLASICDGGILRIANYAAIINFVDTIANNICNGVITPTTPGPTSKVTLVPTNTPTNKTPSPTNTPTTITPSPISTFSPIIFRPTKSPTGTPTKYPTKTKKPTETPTTYPTRTKKPTETPTTYPTRTKYPTKPPTGYPTIRVGG